MTVGQPDPFPLEPWPAGQDYFEFSQFPSDEYRKAVLYSMIEIQDILTTSVRVLAQEAGAQQVTNPSFSHYFAPQIDYLIAVLVVIQNILAKIGCDRYATLLPCQSVRKEKIIIYDGDPPFEEDLTHQGCRDPNVWAFVGDGDGTGDFSFPYFMSICPKLFHAYRGVKRVPAAMLGNVIDPGCTSQEQHVTWSTTKGLLHGKTQLDERLLNWALIQSRTFARALPL